MIAVYSPEITRVVSRTIQATYNHIHPTPPIRSFVTCAQRRVALYSCGVIAIRTRGRVEIAVVRATRRHARNGERTVFFEDYSGTIVYGRGLALDVREDAR